MLFRFLICLGDIGIDIYAPPDDWLVILGLVLFVYVYTYIHVIVKINYRRVKIRPTLFKNTKTSFLFDKIILLKLHKT